jgi:hypothetical protein
MRSLIIGVILAIWGAAIVVRGLTSDPSGNGAYDAGGSIAMVLGAVMVVVGAWTAYRYFARPKPNGPSEPRTSAPAPRDIALREAKPSSVPPPKR